MLAGDPIEPQGLDTPDDARVSLIVDSFTSHQLCVGRYSMNSDTYTLDPRGRSWQRTACVSAAQANMSDQLSVRCPGLCILPTSHT